MGRDCFESSVEHSDGSKPVRVQRVEVITGVERRRNWPILRKLEIVAESEAEGAIVCEVARRHGLHPQQLFGWRAKLRKVAKARSPLKAPAFAPVLVERSSIPANAAGDPNTTSRVEIALGSALVRLTGPVDGKVLAIVLKVLKVIG